ncbi:MAG TPA: hypothetical protein VHF89_10660 [Solirubrobacteraceae bacterium]|nr:hypothetical protein [Solirubrobacteraceae bacterium]
MAKWQLGSLVVFLVIFGITVIVTGEPVYIIPALILAALVFGYAAVNWAATRRMESRHETLDDAMSDEDEPIPSAHLIPDDRTPAGDTPEAHDEINPHDLPTDHPGRQAAEEMAAEEPRDDGARTTRGDDELAQAAPEREEHLEPSGEQRGG